MATRFDVSEVSLEDVELGEKSKEGECVAFWSHECLSNRSAQKTIVINYNYSMTWRPSSPPPAEAERDGRPSSPRPTKEGTEEIKDANQLTLTSEGNLALYEVPFCLLVDNAIFIYTNPLVGAG